MVVVDNVTHVGNSSVHHALVCDTGCTGSYCTPLGVVIHVVGSVGINIGQNLQAMGLEALGPSMMHKPCSSKLWVIGMTTFIIASLVTFGALALASASVLVPLESIQFVVNLIFGKFVRKKLITLRMLFGTTLLILGIFLIVIFGTQEHYCFDVPQLMAFWSNPVWIVYLISTFVVALIFYLVWRRYTAARRAGVSLRWHNAVEPIAFTVSSALFGGGQMIVHTKLLAELLELTAASGQVAFATWFFWVELLLVALSGGYWLFRLSQCLALCACHPQPHPACPHPVVRIARARVVHARPPPRPPPAFAIHSRVSGGSDPPSGAGEAPLPGGRPPPRHLHHSFGLHTYPLPTRCDAHNRPLRLRARPSSRPLCR